MAEKGKIKKLLSCTIECRGMTLVALVGGIGAVVYLGLILGFIFRFINCSFTIFLTVVLIGYVLLLPSWLYLLRKKSKKFERLIAWSILVMFYGIIPCWIFIGGIDCEPPDDADLLLPQSDEPYTDEGNGWTILSNVLSQVEKISNSWMYDGTNTDQRVDAWDLAIDKLFFYANPAASSPDTLPYRPG